MHLHCCTHAPSKKASFFSWRAQPGTAAIRHDQFLAGNLWVPNQAKSMCRWDCCWECVVRTSCQNSELRTCSLNLRKLCMCVLGWLGNLLAKHRVTDGSLALSPDESWVPIVCHFCNVAEGVEFYFSASSMERIVIKVSEMPHITISSPPILVRHVTDHMIW